MIYVLVSIVIFFFTVLFHFFVHRFLLKREVFTMWVFSVYGIWLIINTVVMFKLWQLQVSDGLSEPLPIVGFFLLGILAADTIVFSMSPFLGDESPTSKITLVVEKKGRGSKDEFIR